MFQRLTLTFVYSHCKRNKSGKLLPLKLERNSSIRQCQSWNKHIITYITVKVMVFPKWLICNGASDKLTNMKYNNKCKICRQLSVQNYWKRIWPLQLWRAKETTFIADNVSILNGFLGSKSARTKQSLFDRGKNLNRLDKIYRNSGLMMRMKYNDLSDTINSHSL